MPSTKPNASRKTSAPAKAVSPPLQGSATALQDAAASADAGWGLQLPRSWTRCPLKRHARVIDCKHTTVPFINDGVPLASIREVQAWEVDLTRAKSTTEEDYLHMIEGERDPRPGDIIVSRNATVGAAAIVPRNLRFCMGQDVSLVRCNSSLEPRFVNWLFRSDELITQIDNKCIGSTFLRINVDDIKELVLPLPPLPTQRAIAGYLDRETKRLDELVRAKEGLLELVAEKRRALTTRAVTRGVSSEASAKVGLNPKSPLRDSGIPWLGMIPKHWEVSRLRWLINGIEQGWSPQADLVEADENQWGVIKLSAVKRGEFVANENKALPPNCEVPAHLELRRGDFLLTRANTPALVGDVCVVGETRSKLIFSDLILRLQIDTSKIVPDYLKLLLQCPAGRSQIEADARGSSLSMVKISQEHVPNWLSPVPPLAEQRAIVAHIATETAKLDALRASAERTIRLLKERRSALISAAVTGKIAISEPSA